VAPRGRPLAISGIGSLGGKPSAGRASDVDASCMQVNGSPMRKDLADRGVLVVQTVVELRALSQKERRKDS
jgi:hypothetical protein